MRPTKCSVKNDSPIHLNFTETFNHEEPPIYSPYFIENFDHGGPEPPITTLDFTEDFDS